MFDVFSGIKSLLKMEEVRIDNNVFRLHYKASMIILIVSSLINTARQYIGDPIDCISEGISQNIMNNYCWITSTFTIPSKVGRVGLDLPHKGIGNYNMNMDKVQHHKYYQWVCFVLFFQAVLFYIPRYIWKSWEGGKINILARDLKLVSLNEDAMQSRCKSLCEYFHKNLHHHDLYFYRFFFCELLNLFNVIGQMFLMDRFLGGEFSTYGWEVLNFSEMEQDIRTDPMSKIFPKITMCIFRKYGSSGSIELRDGLCILPINVVNEKIYIFLWFWFIVLAAITSLAIVYRLSIIFSYFLRFVLLRSKFRIAPADDIKYLCSRFRVGDWFMFYQISENIDPFAFKKLIVDLADCLRQRESKNGDIVSRVKLFNSGFKYDEKVRGNECC